MTGGHCLRRSSSAQVIREGSQVTRALEPEEELQMHLDTKTNSDSQNVWFLALESIPEGWTETRWTLSRRPWRMRNRHREEGVAQMEWMLTTSHCAHQAVGSEAQTRDETCSHQQTSKWAVRISFPGNTEPLKACGKNRCFYAGR